MSICRILFPRTHYVLVRFGRGPVPAGLHVTRAGPLPEPVAPAMASSAPGSLATCQPPLARGLGGGLCLLHLHSLGGE